MAEPTRTGTGPRTFDSTVLAPCVVPDDAELRALHTRWRELEAFFAESVLDSGAGGDVTPEREAAMDAAALAASSMLEAFAMTPARTLDGVILKLRTFGELALAELREAGEDNDTLARFHAALLADLEQLAGDR